MWRELQSQRPHDADHPVLACCVGGGAHRAVDNALEPSSGADEHDGPATCPGHQMRDCRCECVPDAGEVGVERRRPQLVRVVPGVRSDGGDRGVGDHDVQSPKRGHPAVHRGPHGRCVPDVDLVGHRPATELLDQAPGLGKILEGGERVVAHRDVRAEIGRDDVRTFAGQRHRVRSALPTCGSGDQRDPAIQLTHLISPALGSRGGRALRTALTIPSYLLDDKSSNNVDNQG